MTSFPIPKVLELPSGDRYHVLNHESGSVFLARNITCSDNSNNVVEDSKGTGKVAIKFEPLIREHHQLSDEADAYYSLAGLPGIPFIHCTGTTEHYRYIIMDLLGPSLEDLFSFCDRRFTLKTILLIADQALSQIKYIHSQSWPHRNIVSENLVIGLGKFGDVLHLINFRSAKCLGTYLDIGNMLYKSLSLSVLTCHRGISSR